MNNDNNDKQQALFRALQAGKLRELVAFRGGTGDLRRELTAKERQARKNRRKEAKASRQFNRRKGVWANEGRTSGISRIYFNARADCDCLRKCRRSFILRTQDVRRRINVLAVGRIGGCNYDSWRTV